MVTGERTVDERLAGIAKANLQAHKDINDGVGGSRRGRSAISIGATHSDIACAGKGLCGDEEGRSSQ